MDFCSGCAERADRLVLAAFGVVCAVAVLLLGLDARDRNGHLAVIFPPWTSGAEALAQASMSGARLVGPGRYPFIVIVAPEAADFAIRVRAAGGFATVGAGLLGGCLNGPVEASS